MIKNGKIGFFLVCAMLTLLHVTSCQNTSSAVPGFEPQGQAFLNQDTLEVQPVQIKDNSLLTKWDSLQKNLLTFTVDSLKPIDLRAQKRKLKDSLRNEFNKKSKHVYLTFDDGPLVGSAAIDSISTAKNIKINAFLIGKHVNMSKGRKRDYQRYMDNKLVACYNHSYTHGLNRFNAFYSNPDGAFTDFQKNEDDLKLMHKIIRLPGRNIWIYDDVRKIDLQSGSSTADLLFSKGYKIYGWDVEWKMHGLTGKPIQSVGEIYHRIRNFMNNKSSQTPNNVVLLMHDDMFQNKKGQVLLSQLIDSLKAENYKFEFMGDYPVKY